MVFWFPAFRCIFDQVFEFEEVGGKVKFKLAGTN